MSKFFMMIGLPGSGKSTIAKEIAEKENAVIVSSDEIRKELFGSEENQESPEKVFNLMYKRTIAALDSDISVIYDATNISSKTRRGFLSQLCKYDIEKIAIMVATPYDECLKRNSIRDRKVPEYVIKRMYMNFNVPCVNEGFSDVRLIYSDDFVKRKHTEIVSSLLELQHDNPHHITSVGVHMRDAYNYLIKTYDSWCDIKSELLYAVLLHDIGKPFTKVFTNSKGEPTEIAHYYNHNNVGAYEILLTDIPEYCKIEAALLVQYHMQYYISWNNSKKAEIRDRQFLGYKLSSFLDILHECDLAAH